MTATQSKAKTPGYNYRLTITFGTDKKGKRIASYFSHGANRAIRVGLANAEAWIAMDQADIDA